MFDVTLAFESCMICGVLRPTRGLFALVNMLHTSNCFIFHLLHSLYKRDGFSQLAKRRYVSWIVAVVISHVKGTIKKSGLEWNVQKEVK